MENIDEAEALLVEEYDVPPDLVDDLFEEIEIAASELIEEYNVVDADASVVEKSLVCGFAEALAEFIDRGVRDQSDVRGLIDDLKRNPVSNMSTIAGRVATRNEDMMRVSEAILSTR